MSVFSDLAKNLLQWGINTAKTEAQQNGLNAVNAAMNELNNVVASHAPAMAPIVTPLAQQIVATLVAGIHTQK